MCMQVSVLSILIPVVYAEFVLITIFPYLPSDLSSTDILKICQHIMLLVITNILPNARNFPE